MVESALVGEFETLIRTTTKLRASSDGTGTRSGNSTRDYLFGFRFADCLTKTSAAGLDV
jgi:hypothetical protein